MDKNRLSVMIGTILLLLGIGMMLAELYDKNRCESMPINELLENDKCKEILGIGE